MFKQKGQCCAESLKYADAAQSETVVPELRAPRTRRASARITLVLIGAASIHACSDTPQEVVQRDIYDNRAKCVQDWGDEQKCEPINDGRSRGYWYGPAYSGGRGGYASQSGDADASKVVPKGRNAIGANRVTRSGFGSSASMHSSGS